MKNDKALLVSTGVFLVDLWLVSRPNCSRGCQTVAEHLIEHGLADFFATLLAYCVSHNIESFRPQRGLTPEGGDQARAAAHATERSSRRFAELPVVLGANVRQFVLLPVGPDVLHRVQFGRVGRQIGRGDPALQTGDVVLHQPAAVRGQTVPHHQQGQAQVAHQGLQKVQHLLLLYRTRVDPKVELPHGEPRRDRQALPIKVVLQDGRLSSRRPGATTMRSLAQTAFVDEDQDAPFPERFFFRAGNPFFFQCWTCSSLRSRARPIGRCGLQPRPTSSFQTWPS